MERIFHLFRIIFSSVKRPAQMFGTSWLRKKLLLNAMIVSSELNSKYLVFFPLGEWTFPVEEHLILLVQLLCLTMEVQDNWIIDGL